MYPVEQHLRRLLLDYDCVTVPGLGGFILQSQPAVINRAKNRILPPSRTISFNSLLNHDDGLLISAVAKSGQMSYGDAGAIVAEFAEKLKQAISERKSAIIEGIGEFSRGEEDKIQFRQSDLENFSREAYGMAPVNLYPLNMKRNTARLAQKPADRKLKPSRERLPGSVKWTVAVSLPVILFLLYGIIFPQSIQDIYTQYSGILSNYHHIEIKNETAPPVVSVVIETPVPVVVKEEPALEEPTLQTSSETLIKQKYYIIGGCFEHQENADKFHADLSARGFNAEKAGTTGRGHIRISYNSFEDKSSALDYLQQIKAGENASAWLLKY
jgi:hypothetical protein